MSGLTPDRDTGAQEGEGLIRQDRFRNLSDPKQKKNVELLVQNVRRKLPSPLSPVCLSVSQLVSVLNVLVNVV